jgi:hypothetical protein
MWTDIVAATGAGGVVFVMIIPQPSDVYNGAAHNLADMMQVYESKTFDRRKGGTVHLTPTNDVQANDFLPQSTVADANNVPWPTALMYVSGPASTNVVTVTVQVNYECHVAGTDIPGIIRAHRPVVESTMKKVTNGVFEGASNVVSNKVEKWAMDTVEGIGEAALDYAGEFFAGLML